MLCGHAARSIVQFKQWILIGLAFCLTLPLAAQVEELNRALSHPLFKQLRRSQESGLNSVQKKLLEEAIDKLPHTLVDRCAAATLCGPKGPSGAIGLRPGAQAHASGPNQPS